MSKSINLKVVVFSLIALFLIYLSLTLDWIFILGAVILMILNQKELLKK